MGWFRKEEEPCTLTASAPFELEGWQEGDSISLGVNVFRNWRIESLKGRTAVLQRETLPQAIWSWGMILFRRLQRFFRSLLP